MTCPICDNKPANCDCTERERWQHEEIERLVAEVERHRMTPAERGVLNEVADLLEESWGRPSSVSKEIRSLLDRTAQKEVGRE